jgi:hypothetical protein
MKKPTRLGVALLILGSATFAWGQKAKRVEFLNTRPGVEFVGSKSCEASGCHEEISRQYYTQTWHGNSMGPADTPEELAKVPGRVSVYDPKADRHYEIVRLGSELFQTQYQVDASGHRIYSASHKLKYRIGGNFTGSIYIVQWGQNLFQAPLSHYVAPNQWELAPGYAGAPRPFNRAIVMCPYCHNGQPNIDPQKPGVYRDPPFRFGEYAISCEACHGPGELHLKDLAENPRRKKGKIDRTIVNPARLPPRLADDVCLKCHEGWASRVVQPGKTELDYRPGLPLYDTVALFKIPIPIERREELEQLASAPPVRGSVETPLWFKHSLMEMSKCYQATQGRMTCITCHIIHKPPAKDTKVEYYRERCLGCHSNTSCRLTLAERSKEQPVNDCVRCHMPRRGVAGIPHSDDASHRIVRRPGQPFPDSAFEASDPDVPGLIIVNRRGADKRKPVSPLVKLRAYSDIMGLKKLPEAATYYLELLEELRKTHPDDPVVLMCLGRKAVADGDHAAAIGYLTRALERGGTFDTTYLDLAQALIQMDRKPEAAEVLEKGVAMWPFSPDLQQALVLCYMSMQSYSQARRVLEQYVALFPEDTIAREGLARARAAGN